MSDSRTVVFTGYLTKMGRVRKSWKRRLFKVFSDGCLEYYKVGASSESKVGEVDLNSCTVILPGGSCMNIKWHENAHLNFTFAIVTTSRRLFVYADNLADLEEWLKVLHSAAPDNVPIPTSEDIRQSWIERGIQVPDNIKSDQDLHRVTVFKNGSEFDGKVIILPESLQELKDSAASHLNMAYASRVFNEVGAEITEIDMVRDDDLLFMSEGGDFIGGTGEDDDEDDEQEALDDALAKLDEEAGYIETQDPASDTGYMNPDYMQPQGNDDEDYLRMVDDSTMYADPQGEGEVYDNVGMGPSEDDQDGYAPPNPLPGVQEDASYLQMVDTSGTYMEPDAVEPDPYQDPEDVRQQQSTSKVDSSEQYLSIQEENAGYADPNQTPDNYFEPDALPQDANYMEPGAMPQDADYMDPAQQSTQQDDNYLKMLDQDTGNYMEPETSEPDPYQDPSEVRAQGYAEPQRSGTLSDRHDSYLQPRGKNNAVNNDQYLAVEEEGDDVGYADPNQPAPDHYLHVVSQSNMDSYQDPTSVQASGPSKQQQQQQSEPNPYEDPPSTDSQDPYQDPIEVRDQGVEEDPYQDPAEFRTPAYDQQPQQNMSDIQETYHEPIRTSSVANSRHDSYLQPRSRNSDAGPYLQVEQTVNEEDAGYADPQDVPQDSYMQVNDPDQHGYADPQQNPDSTSYLQVENGQSEDYATPQTKGQPSS